MKRFPFTNVVAVIGIALAAIAIPATASAISITRDAGPGNVTGNAGSVTVQIGSVGSSCASSTFTSTVPNSTANISGSFIWIAPCSDSFGGTCSFVLSPTNWTLKATSLAGGSASMTLTTGSLTENCDNCHTLTIAAGQVIINGVGGNVATYTNANTSLAITATLAYGTVSGLCLVVIAASGRLTITQTHTFSGANAVTVT